MEGRETVWTRPVDCPGTVYAPRWDGGVPRLGGGVPRLGWESPKMGCLTGQDITIAMDTAVDTSLDKSHFCL